MAFTPNPEAVKMGPAIVMYDGKDLGYTMNDSVSINLTQNTTPIQPDQASVPISDRITSMECTVDMELADVSNETLTMLAGFDEGGLKDPTGIDMLELGKTLTIAPLDADDNRKYTFTKAVPILNGAINFARETVSTLPIQFKCYIDTTDGYIFKLGTNTGE
jgi:hypothetical protein